MPKVEYILDLGSHSAKLYRKNNNHIVHVNTVTWELLETEEVNLQMKINEILSQILVGENTQSIKAIGTAAMRRNPHLARKVSNVCSKLGVTFRTISQREEAYLIKEAILNSNIPKELDIINVGGGSIQLLLGPNKEEHLLNFGISDLNRLFNLNSKKEQRQHLECIEWIYEKLPLNLNVFCYTGGEKTYLEHFNVPIISGYCYLKDFSELSEKISEKETHQLLLDSPFDSNWMNGAIASNCIVIGALKRAKANRFYPSNLNIAHGFYQLI